MQVSDVSMFNGIHEQVVEANEVILLIARAIVPVIPPDGLCAVGGFSDYDATATVDASKYVAQLFAFSAVTHQMIVVV